MSSEPTGFLYPFIEAEERDAGSLLSDLAVSAQSKMSESESLRAATLERCADGVQRAAEAMVDRFSHGGRLFTFGNGGSATDAEGSANLFRNPPFGKPLPAVSLVDDQAVLTALANDVGFELVFSRQIIAHARSGDIAIGFSTSGDSGNVLRAFEEAQARDLLTVGLSGSAGGAMADSKAVGYCLVVRSESIHRIQEAQNALVWRLWSTIQQRLADRGET